MLVYAVRSIDFVCIGPCGCSTQPQSVLHQKCAYVHVSSIHVVESNKCSKKNEPLLWQPCGGPGCVVSGCLPMHWWYATYTPAYSKCTTQTEETKKKLLDFQSESKKDITIISNWKEGKIYRLHHHIHSTCNFLLLYMYSTIPYPSGRCINVSRRTDEWKFQYVNKI